MALKIIQHLSHGERMPLGYGIAWFTDWSRDRVVCMPVPLNVLARVLRDAWCYVATIGYEVPVNPRAAYLAGKTEGRLALFDDMASMGVELGRREDQL
jgi:hypothetical protein